MSNGVDPIRMAQYGTKHGHAEGVLQVMLENPDVEVVGVHEPDAARREELQRSDAAPWPSVRWLDKSEYSTTRLSWPCPPKD